VARPAPLTVRRYIAQGIKRKPIRSGLTIAGVAVAVAFFVLFASLSAGLHDFVNDELDQPRPTHLTITTQSPTPLSSVDVALVGTLAAQALDPQDARWSLSPRIELPLSSAEGRPPARLWGVVPLEVDAGAAPPYDPSAPLGWGRHLEPVDEEADPASLVCVMGQSLHEELFTGKGEGDPVGLSPDASVDPWWLPAAEEYPVEGKDLVMAEARGPLQAILVGVFEAQGDDDLDWGVFVPLHPLLEALNQYDRDLRQYYYPQVVVTVEDGRGVELGELEMVILEAFPRTRGTDDAWDEEGFEGTYGQASEALDGWLVTVTVVMMIMLIAGVSDTMLVMVSDRRTEIATLRAVGLRRRQVAGLVMGEVLLLALAGLATGLLLGGGLTGLFGMLHESTGGTGLFFAPIGITPWVLLGAVALSLGSSVLAAAYPARRAAQGSPTEALRYE
jgi:putative ABC transport system permease protein